MTEKEKICKNCKWWGSYLYNVRGICNHSKFCMYVSISNNHVGNYVITHIDFGCIFWEENQ